MRITMKAGLAALAGAAAAGIAIMTSPLAGAQAGPAATPAGMVNANDSTGALRQAATGSERVVDELSVPLSSDRQAMQQQDARQQQHQQVNNQLAQNQFQQQAARAQGNEAQLRQLQYQEFGLRNQQYRLAQQEQGGFGVTPEFAGLDLSHSFD